MTTTLNGWPYPAKNLVTKQVPGTKRKLTLNAICAPLMLALASDYHRTVRAIDKGTWDEGGYNDRDANGAAGRKSNHANGTAMDLNWSEEGAQGSAWGKRFFAQAKVRLAIAVLKKRYGSCVQWGGDWRALDYMHWEIKPGTTQLKVADLIKKLGIDKDGVRTK